MGRFSVRGGSEPNQYTEQLVKDDDAWQSYRACRERLSLAATEIIFTDIVAYEPTLIGADIPIYGQRTGS